MRRRRGRARSRTWLLGLALLGGAAWLGPPIATALLDTISTRSDSAAAEPDRKPAAPDTAEAHSHVEHAEIVNIREALKWAFAPGGDPAIGVALTVASAPVWLALSQFDEFRNWMRKAAAALSGQQMGGHDTVVPFKIADLPRVA